MRRVFRLPSSMRAKSATPGGDWIVTPKKPSGPEGETPVPAAQPRPDTGQALPVNRINARQAGFGSRERSSNPALLHHPHAAAAGSAQLNQAIPRR